MNLNIDISKLTNADLVTLAWVCGIIMVVFVLLLISQRKYLTFFRKRPQYKLDAEKYERMAEEARQNHANAREALKQADDYLLALNRQDKSGQDRATGEDADSDTDAAFSGEADVPEAGARYDDHESER